jgi:hypothetical protein
MTSTDPRPADERAQANRDAAREHGNHIAAIADIAEAQLDEAEHELAARTQYEDGLQVLRFLIGAPWPERVLEIDRVLHDEHGSLRAEKAVEFIELLLEGQSSMQARQEMLARQPGRVQRARVTRGAVAAARRVSANLHLMAEAPRVQPALPPAGGAVSNGVALPHRGPIAPPPPMVPPAPPETPAEQTGQLVAVVQEARATGRISGQSIQALHNAGYGAAPHGPDFGPTPSPAFAPSAIPAQRALGDTVTMHADEVLAELAADDASAEHNGADDAPSGPRPFAAADTATRSAAVSGRDAEDDH